jgi:hypothetical protein
VCLWLHLRGGVPVWWHKLYMVYRLFTNGWPLVVVVLVAAMAITMVHKTAS